MIEATLCIPVQGEGILLGKKLRGFGKGKYVGFGGKIEPGESPAEAAARELNEEAGITAENLDEKGRIVFRFPYKPEWDITMTVFCVRAWQGTPTPGDEIAPEWFTIDAVPYDKMWDDARHWLPHVLNGKCISAEFVYGDDNEHIIDYSIEIA